METLKKVKGDKTWHDIILECMKQTEADEINPFALRALCMGYDLDSGDFPKSHYEGYSLLSFFLERRKLPFLEAYEEDWQKRLMELRTITEEKEE